jgi:20S proteasome subunit beta 4
LYWLDEYGSLQNIQYGAHGHGSNFILSVLDQGYRPNLTLEEATKPFRDCFQQLRTRYVINSPQPSCIKCVDARGCRLIRWYWYIKNNENERKSNNDKEIHLVAMALPL